LNFEEPRFGQIGLLFTPLTVQEVNDALDDIDCLGGDQAVLELQRSRLVGFTGLDKMATAVIKECTITHIQTKNGSDAKLVAPSVPQRVGVWRELLAKQCPALAKFAEQYLPMHATSCAAERNLSVWGRVYDKCRGSLKLEKAENMVFLHYNGKLQRECDVGMSEPLLFEELIDDEAEQDVVDQLHHDRIEQDIANESQLMHDDGTEQDSLEKLGLTGSPVDKMWEGYLH
jgi:hAT family C-terminal dimerisation region